MDLFVLFLSANLLAAAIGHPDGAPAEACATMVPLHHAPPKTTPCPYRTVFDEAQIRSDQSLSVRLQSADVHPFKGYLVMAFDNKTGAAVGTFSRPSDGQVIDCLEALQNAVTHRRPSTKTSVQVTWTPPRNFDGLIIFRTTFVMKGKTFWVGQPSAVLRVGAASRGADPAPLGRVYDDCGRSKGCYGHPSGCVDERACSMMVTYRRSDDGARFQLELYGAASGDAYVAAGFGRSHHMGDASVVECTVDDDRVEAHTSFNEGKHNRRDADSSARMDVLEAQLVDGRLYCRVDHVTQWTSHGLHFDLTQRQYLLLARGPTSRENIHRHVSKTSSHHAVDLTDPQSLRRIPSRSDVAPASLADQQPQHTRILKKLHGAFMVVAWLLLASVGTFFPRYLKQTWGERRWMDLDRWLQLHRASMVAVWLLTVAAFALIVIDVGGWVPQSVSENPHPLIGAIATGLAFLQPLMAALRPAPGTPRRPFFNTSHALVGYSTHALAVTCIFLAVEMEAAQLPWCTYWLLAAQVLCYVTGHIVFSVLAKTMDQTMESVKKHADSQGSNLRRNLLALYVVLLLAPSLCVLFFISQSSDGKSPVYV